MARIRGGSLALLIGTLAGCSGGGGSTPEPAVVLTSCDPVAQTGCSAGKKCTWIRISTSGTPTGALACTPAGAVDVGAACQYGVDGATTGYDDCRGGQVCLASETSAASGTCERICDSSNVLSCTPASQWACVGYSNFFANGAGMPVAGLCDSQCDPVTQVRLSDGAAACGSPNPAAPTRGCYGTPGSSTYPTVFTCTAAGPSNMTERTVIAGTVYVNSCAPGYLPLMVQSTGSMSVICSAVCDPAATTLQSHLDPGGLSPYSCQDAGGGATEECRYWWWLEDPAAPVTAWSNGIGFCIDYTQYTYGTMPPTTYPSCTALSSTAFDFSTTVNDATYWGCTAH
jgi:hypothetical protein